MSSVSAALRSSIGRKIIMGVTGLFLISFLLVHVGINSLIFFNDGGRAFNEAAHFMGTNLIIRTMEIVLFIGLILHAYQAFRLVNKNQKSRPVKYAHSGAPSNTKWYSRSMGLLGTIILMFLVVHLANFWVKSRFTGLQGLDEKDHPNLYSQMQVTFSNVWVVVLYVLAMISLAYHLLHGFASAFQTLGINHKKYTPAIKVIGVLFSILVPVLFASMPLAFILGFLK